MKPGFALTLSEDGIGLLHRSKGGWQRLGDVSLDDPGLGETLRLMRNTAEGLATGTLLTKLVIPDSQILYTTLPFSGESQAEKRASLRRGLDGLTPYAVDELVFDWQDLGDGTARLAVVARETLDEAEGFAAQHHFNPVCCVAAPPAGKFDGEAFFGPTALAPGLLGKGQTPQRDGRAVRPGGMADYAAGDDAPAAPKSAPRPPSKGKPRAAPAASPAIPDAPATSTPADPAVPFATRRRGEGEETRAPAERPLDDAPPAPSRLTLATPRPDVPHGGNTPASLAPAADSREPSPAAGKPLAVDVPARPSSGTVQTDRPRPSVAPAGAPSKAPSPPLAAPPRRAAAQTLAEIALGQAKARPGRGNLRLGIALTGALVLAMAAVSIWSLLPEGGERAETPAAAPEVGDALAALPDEPVTAPPALRTPGTPSVAEDAPAATPDLAPPEPAPVEPTAPEPPSPAAPFSETDAAEAYASTGLWQVAPEPPAAPPQDRIENLYVAALDPAIRPPDAVDLPDPRRTEANDQPLPLQADPPGPDETFVLDERGFIAATPEGALTPEGVMVFAGQPPLLPRGRRPAEVDDPEDSQARATEPAMPEGMIVADGVEVAAIPEAAPEESPATSEVAAEPPANPEPAADPEPPAVADPAPVAAPETGVVVVEGRPSIVPPRRPELVVPVTLGRPPVTPPARPGPEAAVPQEPAAPEAADPEPAPATETEAGDAAATSPVQATETAAAAPEAQPEATDLPETAVLVADAATAMRLAPFRPQLRPEGLVPAAMPAAAPPAAEAPDPGLRPRARPEAMAAALAARAPELGADIEAALQAALSPEEQAEASAEPEAEEPEPNLARSIRPAARPSDLDDRLAATAPAAAPAVPPAAAARAPRIPTSANVARQATVENAINLGKLNLIGVYGSSGDRRALVRLPSGRYEKLKVGDRLDGGSVAAIGESQLRYVKNGRNIVLDLPGG
ncbi:hypothetical protein [Rhodovulum euryhalinum]|uniref:Type IV pilus biogenesis protein PilP n=1 Tax=Rhodovulum euryhalinum TaxID=35805 RepID=A0A4R2KE36_9RHOB|nr:hypothetical protein [Rhodovulum euryhalinum]TCO71244.1 hypothetical protein EV655_107137 [Rhodovulum euryhalinum]